MRAFILVALILNLSACANRHVLTIEKNFWLDEASEYQGIEGFYYCKANDQGDMKDSQPVCYQTERKGLKDHHHEVPKMPQAP